MDTKAAILCRRIELYRRYLRESVDAALVFDYLREIVAAGDGLADLLRSDTAQSRHVRWGNFKV
jgi:hypothetical protein